MAVVQPFRALRYDERRAGPLEALVAPPYDVIGPEERARLLARSPYNVVHLTLPDDEREAARRFHEWRRDGVLVEEEQPSFWALTQDYAGPDGVERTRTGLVVSLRAEPYETGAVLPHERTHEGPKEGRLRLLRAVRAQLEPIFLLYDGDPPAQPPDRPPDIETAGARLWRIGVSEQVERAFRDRRLLIADGHHRYETAVAFHEQEQTPASAFTMAVLVSTQDTGLMIFPTHRIVERLEGMLPSVRNGDARTALRRLEEDRSETSAAVVYARTGAGTLYGRAGELDTELVERYHPQGVSYTAYADEAIEAVDSGKAQAAFLLRPPRIEQVFAVAERGATMPQKSTYFYPKLLSGLLFHPV
jgi:uncharacterized protein (DUF1015 family)